MKSDSRPMAKLYKTCQQLREWYTQNTHDSYCYYHCSGLKTTQSPLILAKHSIETSSIKAKCLFALFIQVQLFTKIFPQIENAWNSYALKCLSCGVLCFACESQVVGRRSRGGNHYVWYKRRKMFALIKYTDEWMLHTFFRWTKLHVAYFFQKQLNSDPIYTNFNSHAYHSYQSLKKN